MRRCWCRWLSAMMTTMMLMQPDVDGEARTRLTLSKKSRRGGDAWMMKSSTQLPQASTLHRRLHRPRIATKPALLRQRQPSTRLAINIGLHQLRRGHHRRQPSTPTSPHRRRHHRSWSTSTPNGFFFAESGLNPRHLLLLQLDLLQQTSSSSITTSPPELEYLLFFLLRNQRRKPTVKRRIFFAPPTDSDSHGL